MSRQGGTPGGQFEGPGGVYLMDAATHNAIGYYPTEEDALRDVAESASEHGRQSAKARNLLMYRDGEDSVDGSVGGDALIARALDQLRQPAPRAPL